MYDTKHTATNILVLPRLRRELHERRHHEAAGAGIPEGQPRRDGAKLRGNLQRPPRTGRQGAVLAKNPGHHLHQLFFRFMFL